MNENDDVSDMEFEWFTYRKDYGVTETTVARKAFFAGWKAALDGRPQDGALR